MRKRLFLITTFIMTIFCFNIYEVDAYSAENYKHRALCAKYELLDFKSTGEMERIGCYPSYVEGKAAMQEHGGDGLGLLTMVNGYAKIIDANTALLDLSVNPETLTYFYEQPETDGRKYTYMDTGSLYGGVDGAHIESYPSGVYGWNVKVKIGNFTGWIRQTTYEIVPITWVKSTSSYTVTNDYIKHNYVNKIQETYTGSRGRTIGPKPEMLSPGNYYSYDGHYFYNNIKTMIKDYKAGNFNNAVNKDNEYYNYYMYLSNHTKTNYSSTNIDEYVRNYLGYNGDVYGNKSGSGKSRLYGKGAFFYYAQEKYGVNAILSLSLSRNETGNGTSNLAINKNNGFGLNAVDSSPTESANWYASFASSILGYANKWITYGYAHPRDWRYFGPQFGDKGIGMNVKYASDTYWSEKMASNYYALDSAYGLQDYNFYQLGVVTQFNVVARRDAYNSSPSVYTYPESEDALVIVGEKQGDAVNGNTTWYKVISDLNIDSNYNEITSGYYNWNGYVYVPAAYVKLINKRKTEEYQTPNDVTEYQDSSYEYDLLIENTELKPKIGLSLENTPYYYDATLLNKNGETLLKNRYVMVYTIAYDENKKPVSYLVTSDYWYDQKHWVDADSIKFVSGEYGKSNVDVYNCNCYTWVNYNTVDVESTKISGLFTNTYVPVLEKKTVDGYLWYRVPVNLKGNSNEFGWTLATAPDIKIDLYKFTVANQAPVINAKDISIVQGTTFEELKGITAKDNEDGDLTKSIIVLDNPVNIDVVGTYTVKYQVTDKQKETTIKEIKVTVTENKKPVINAKDITTTLGKVKRDLLEGVSATDEEDGKLTDITVDDSKVNYEEVGEYIVTYKVKDSYNQEITLEVKLTILESSAPVINASDKTITIGEKFDAKQGVTATDEEDGDLTEKIEVIKNTVKEDILGTYEVTYQVTDKNNKTVTKTIKVTVAEIIYEKKEALYVFDSLITTNDELKIKGSLAIAGVQHTLLKNITYKLIFENNNTKERTEQELVRIVNKDDIPFEIKDGAYDYTYSWFNGTISFNNIEEGDYTLYVAAYDNEAYYTETVLSNVFGDTMENTYNTTDTSVAIRNNYESREAPIQMFVREESLGEKNTSSRYNMNNEYSSIEFKDNKLVIRGASHIIGGDYSLKTEVKRTMIFENIQTFKTKKFDIGSITNGDYVIELRSPDGKDKTRAWYETNIDVSTLEKGTYSIYVSTQSNLSDYGELQDIFANKITATKTIDNKTYSFKVDRENRYRILLIVE